MKKLFIILAMPVMLAITSCGRDEDKSVKDCGGFCPNGYECIDDVCVKKTSEFETVVVSGSITTPTTWTSDKVYELAGKVIVENTTLTIEPGTIIKGRTGTGSLASALVIARGAKINACGTPQKPIIFTSELDDIKPGELTGSNLGKNDNEKWGGLIVLGNAPVSVKNSDTEGHIEGIPADETYGVYGGTDENDSSGSLCYVSVRHGGAVIGDGNEINGITLGGVGSGTKIENIEVVANLDDGIEIFGGTANLKNVIVCYQYDDAIDIDQNYKGTIDNFYVIHGGIGTDNGLEIDGPEGSTHTDGKFTLVNGTLVSEDGEGSCANLKSKAQGNINGLSFVGYKKFMKVSAKFDKDNDCAAITDAYDNLVNGKLVVSNTQIVSSDASLEDFIEVYTKVEDCQDELNDEFQTAADEAITNNNNQIASKSDKGADKSVFEGWSWTYINNFIK